MGGNRNPRWGNPSFRPALLGGCTNSRHSPESWTDRRAASVSGLLSDRGLDTVRFRWREGSEAYERFQRRREGYQEWGSRGERYVQTELGRLGVFPDGLTYLEGRASAIATWNKTDHDLLPPDQLLSAEQAAREWATHNQAEVSGPATLGRVDLASELRFGDPEEGGAFLHSLAALDVPWCKSRVDGRKGSNVETVSFHGTRGRTIYLRAYDKGVESGSDGPGRRIRVERQKRFRKDREPLSVGLNVVDLRKWYVGREFDKLSDLPSASVADLRGSLMAVYERAETVAQAERLAGFLVLGSFLKDEYRRSSYYSRTAELRSLGIFVDPAQAERLEVPVGQYLQTLAAAWA